MAGESPAEPSESIPDPGGKNVVDFATAEHPGRRCKRSVRLLPPSKRRLLFLAAGVQISLGLLDLLGIALVGLLAAVGGVGAPGSPAIPAPSRELLTALGLGDLTTTQLSALIAVTAVFVLVAKTALAAVMQRRDLPVPRQPAGRRVGAAGARRS